MLIVVVHVHIVLTLFHAETLSMLR